MTLRILVPLGPAAAAILDLKMEVPGKERISHEDAPVYPFAVRDPRPGSSGARPKSTIRGRFEYLLFHHG
jgi:hypothetical protein